jgi:hypothetical protein
MIRRIFARALFSIIVIGASAFVRPTQLASAEPCALDHDVWLAHLIARMDSIKPGMTRLDLLQVFKPEGGPPTRQQKDCDVADLLVKTVHI